MKTQVIKNLFVSSLLVCFFTACNQEDDSYRLNTRQVELNCRATQALQVTPALPGLSYTSLNTNIATVSPEGLITAKLVGTTKIVVKDSLNLFVDTVKVVVKSVNTLFEEPCLKFGINHTTLIATLNLTNVHFAYPPNDGYRVIFYEKELEWFYHFSDENKLTDVFVYVPDNEYTLLESHLSDRYSYMITRQNEYSSELSSVDAYYINPDSTLIVADIRFSLNAGSNVYFYPATKEKIQHILSDSTYFNFQ